MLDAKTDTLLISLLRAKIWRHRSRSCSEYHFSFTEGSVSEYLPRSCFRIFRRDEFCFESEGGHAVFLSWSPPSDGSNRSEPIKTSFLVSICYSHSIDITSDNNEKSVRLLLVHFSLHLKWDDKIN
ncbi:hypothetical protein Y032_0868g2782 [Ancylostoma ceylanicum]|uniref:Uncharacterized protein n=1 Tax=Ancylostoma ceylanicum TaxID=53326 RepID=A0A016WA11_9BILA|nr:hypothetical protein Y032_0868g2782 [Ancylostoma ceylanicum]